MEYEILSKKLKLEKEEATLNALIEIFFENTRNRSFCKSQFDQIYMSQPTQDEKMETSFLW